MNKAEIKARALEVCKKCFLWANNNSVTLAHVVSVYLDLESGNTMVRYGEKVPEKHYTHPDLCPEIASYRCDGSTCGESFLMGCSERDELGVLEAYLTDAERENYSAFCAGISNYYDRCEYLRTRTGAEKRLNQELAAYYWDGTCPAVLEPWGQTVFEADIVSACLDELLG